MANTLYPAFVKIYYEDALSPHVQTFQVDDAGFVVGSGIPQVADSIGAAHQLPTKVTEWVNLLRPCAPATCTFQRWEYWMVAAPGADPVFTWADDINLAGSGAGAHVPASQVVWSYRTAAGGKGMIYLMSSGSAANAKGRAPTFINVAFKAVADYLVSNTCIIKGRDDSKPVAVVKVLTKTNDALRRKLRLS